MTHWVRDVDASAALAYSRDSCEYDPTAAVLELFYKQDERRAEEVLKLVRMYLFCWVTHKGELFPDVVIDAAALDALTIQCRARHPRSGTARGTAKRITPSINDRARMFRMQTDSFLRLRNVAEAFLERLVMRSREKFTAALR